MNEIFSFLTEAWQLHAHMSFWLLMGFLFSALLGILVPASFITRHLAGSGWGAIWKASLLGVPLPLCSCSVIPTGLGLLKRGASRAATMSFLTSTPQTGVESFMLAGGTLGWPFALTKALSAFLMGILVGGLSPKQAESNETAFNSPEAPKSWQEMFAFGFIELPRTLFKPYAIGILASAIMIHWLDPRLVADYVGHGWGESISILLLSVPLYLCATASIPLGVAMLHQGISLGGVAIFLVAGPATNLISLLMIAKTLGRRSAIVYLSVIVMGSMLLSFLINHLLDQPQILAQHLHQHESLTWFDQICAIALMLLYVARYIPKFWTTESRVLPEGQVEMSLSGLTCGGCMAKLQTAFDKAEIKTYALTLDSVQVNEAQLEHAKTIVEASGFKHHLKNIKVGSS